MAAVMNFSTSNLWLSSYKPITRLICFSVFLSMIRSWSKKYLLYFIYLLVFISSFSKNWNLDKSNDGKSTIYKNQSMYFTYLVNIEAQMFYKQMRTQKIKCFSFIRTWIEEKVHFFIIYGSQFAHFSQEWVIILVFWVIIATYS